MWRRVLSQIGRAGRLKSSAKDNGSLPSVSLCKMPPASVLGLDLQLLTPIFVLLHFLPLFPMICWRIFLSHFFPLFVSSFLFFKAFLDLRVFTYLASTFHHYLSFRFLIIPSLNYLFHPLVCFLFFSLFPDLFTSSFLYFFSFFSPYPIYFFLPSFLH